MMQQCHVVGIFAGMAGIFGDVARLGMHFVGNSWGIRGYGSKWRGNILG